MTKIENKFRGLSKWKSVSEMPNFPFDSFEKLKDAVQESKYTIGIDYSAATEFASLLHSGFWKFVVIMLAFIPWIALAIAIVSSVILKNYYLLFGIPIIGVTFGVSNPLCPYRSFVSRIGYMGTICMVFVVFMNNQTLLWLLLSFVLTFWDVRIIYEINAMTLRQAVMDSESLFMYCYEKKACTIKNSQTEKVYFYGEQVDGV